MERQSSMVLVWCGRIGIALGVFLGIPGLSLTKSLFFPTCPLPPLGAGLNQGAEISSEALPASRMKLQGILYRSDLQSWVVWLNDQRLDPEHPTSAEGWTVVEVTTDTVILHSAHGEEVCLSVRFGASSAPPRRQKNQPR